MSFVLLGEKECLAQRRRGSRDSCGRAKRREQLRRFEHLRLHRISSRLRALCLLCASARNLFLKLPDHLKETVAIGLQLAATHAADLAQFGKVGGTGSGHFAQD